MMGDKLRDELERELIDEAAAGFLPQPKWAKNMESRLQAHVSHVAAAVLDDLEAIRNGLLQQFQQIVDAAVVSIVTQLQEPPSPTNPGPATGLKATIGGNMSSVTLSVDVQGETIHADWVDDKGDLTADIPAGAQIGFTSSDAAVATVGASVAAGTGADAPLSFLKAGAVVFTATAEDAAGTALAGFTAATVDVTLTPGAAAGLMASVAGAPPVPAPAPTPAPDPTPPAP